MVLLPRPACLCPRTSLSQRLCRDSAASMTSRGETLLWAQACGWCKSGAGTRAETLNSSRPGWCHRCFHLLLHVVSVLNAQAVQGLWGAAGDNGHTAHSSALGREPHTSVMKAAIVLDKVPTPKESTLGSALACLAW